MSSRLFTVPNVLTYARIVAVPLVAAAFYLHGDTGRWLAFWIFLGASLTDWFDGYLARVFRQQSVLGRMLDPIADKLLVAVCLLVLVREGTISDLSLWAAVIILMREIFVSGLREFLAELRVSVPVSWLAKWKTAVQLIALGFLLLGPAGNAIVPGCVPIGLTLLWLSALITLYTGFDYLRAGLGHILESE